MNLFTSSKFRQWLYGVVLVLVPILVVYGVVEQQYAALWIALAAAILGQGTAFGAITSQRRAGILPDTEPSEGRHAKPDELEDPKSDDVG